MKTSASKWRAAASVVVAASALLAVAPAARAISAEDRAAVEGYLESSRDELLAVTVGLTADELARKPDPESWSIAEIAEHLAIVESVVQERVRKVLAPSAPHPEWQLDGRSLMRDAVVRLALTNRDAKRFKAPELVSPKGVLSPREAIAGFERARRESLEYVRASSDDLRSRFLDHPVLGTIDGVQWLLFLGAHTERHILQAREVRAALEGARRSSAAPAERDLLAGCPKEPRGTGG